MEDTDSGSSLIDAVVGISLLGFVLIGVVDASFANTRVAAQTRDRARESNLLSEAARALKSAQYSPCPHIDHSYDLQLEGAIVNLSPAHDVTITNYEYWDGVASQWTSLDAVSSVQCSALSDFTGPFAVQRITVTVEDAQGRTTSAVVVKTLDSEMP